MKKAWGLSLLIIFVLSIVGCNQSMEDKNCEKQCEAYFKKEYGEGLFDNREGAGTITFKYHYHQKLKKCFLFLDENGYVRRYDKLYEKKSLLDVNDKKTYGSYSNIIGISTDCNFLGKTCRSEEEWDQLAKPYMKE